MIESSVILYDCRQPSKDCHTSYDSAKLFNITPNSLEASTIVFYENIRSLFIAIFPCLRHEIQKYKLLSFGPDFLAQGYHLQKSASNDGCYEVSSN